jgi:peroxiredoxin Q/BCP
MYMREYRIEVGEMAPDIMLPDTEGKTVRLYDYKNKNTVLLFFFNHRNERCLARLSMLANDYDQYRKAGVAVLPVTIVHPDEGEKLASRLHLPFPIVCDENHVAVQDYRMGECSDTPSHVCFEIITKVLRPTMLVIDTSGVIRYKQRVDPSGTKPDDAALLRECRESLK